MRSLQEIWTMGLGRPFFFLTRYDNVWLIVPFGHTTCQWLTVKGQKNSSLSELYRESLRTFCSSLCVSLAIIRCDCKWLFDHYYQGAQINNDTKIPPSSQDQIRANVRTTVQIIHHIETSDWLRWVMFSSSVRAVTNLLPRDGSGRRNKWDLCLCVCALVFRPSSPPSTNTRRVPISVLNRNKFVSRLQFTYKMSGGWGGCQKN